LPGFEEEEEEEEEEEKEEDWSFYCESGSKSESGEWAAALFLFFLYFRVLVWGFYGRGCIWC
jgi:hypothetical protein